MTCKDEGPLAFVGGGEWQHGCSFDRALIDSVGATEVVVLPTAAAYEHPARSVDAAREWFSQLGVGVRGLEALQRRDAEDEGNAGVVRAARFIYISDGSPLHLRSVIKGSSLWDALTEAWRAGAVIAGSAAGATVLGDPMVDPRGGAFTLGLGLVRKFALVPHWERWTGDRARRMSHLTPKGAVVAEVEEQTALVRWGDGRWEKLGSGSVDLMLDHQPIGPDQIEAVIECGPLAVPVDRT